MALKFVEFELVISREQIKNLTSWTIPLMVVEYYSFTTKCGILTSTTNYVGFGFLDNTETSTKA
jgi:hypothetical protein